MSVNVYVEQPKTMKMKNDLKALAFTATFWDDDWSPHVIRGFRLMDGIINAPAAQSGGKWYQITYLPVSWAKLLYETVSGMDWVKTYGLPAMQPVDLTVFRLTLNPRDAINIAPSLVTSV